MINCTATACTAGCVDQPAAPISTPARLVRTAGLIVVVGVGVFFIATVAGLPGHRRNERTAWALQRVSRRLLAVLGVRMVVEGTPRSGPSLVVGNHTSWIDVLALSASAPMRMVAKAEILQWPVIGPVARRVGTVFLRRDRWRELPGVVAEITAALRSGSRVQVFPEGTTRCGGALDPFHRAAFQAAIDAGVVVSPVTVRYLGPGGAATRIPAFVGDERLVVSVRRVLTGPPTTVRVRWLRPIPAIAGTGRDAVDRAVVARLAQNAVARDLGMPVVRSVRGAPGRSVSPTAVGGLPWRR